MNSLQLPAVERVRGVLTYSPETGVFTWRESLSNSAAAGRRAGARNSKGYVSIGIDGKKYQAHRIAWLYCYGVDPGDSEIDHIDMDKANNAITNLRLATRKQNNENIGLPKNSTSGVRGVSFQKNEKHWTAYIYHNRKRIHLGCFKEMQPAVEARIAAEAALFTHSSDIKGGQHGTESST